MKVVLDNVIFELQKSGGISVVWYELLQRLQQVNDLELYFLDNQSTNNYYRGNLNIDKSRIISPSVKHRLSRYQSVNVEFDEPFIFHSSYYRYCTNRHAINVTTVHDFTYEFFLRGLKRYLHSWQKSKAIRHSDGIACISESTKNDLLTLLPNVSKEKVTVIYNGVSEEYRPLSPTNVALALPFPSKTYVMFIGKRDVWKNFPLAVQGVSQTDYRLLIVGNPLNMGEQELVDHYMPSSQYKCIGFVSNEELNRLYNEASALIYPSYYEGFGLPVLEAQRAGCPVIAYNASSIPEVIGKTPLLMTEQSATELAGKLNLLNQPSIVDEARMQGLENVRRFSWDKMAQEYIELYQRLSKADLSA